MALSPEERAGPRSAAWLRAVLQLMLVAASSWLLLCQLALATPALWFGTNDLSRTARLLAVGGAGFVALAVALVSWLVPRARSSAQRCANLLGPLALSACVPVLLYRPLWKGRALELLVLLAVLARLLEVWLLPCLTELALLWRARSEPAGRRLQGALARMQAHAQRWPVRWPAPSTLAVLALMLFYMVRISSLTLLTHHTLQTSHSDLAEFDNLFFNALHGHPFRTPASAGDMRDWSGLKTHAEFLLYLVLPFYALAPRAEALLVLQTLAVALTAFPIYGLAARRLGQPAGALLAAAYLLLPATVQPNFYDFHFTPFGMLWVSSALYWLDRAYLSPAPEAAAPARRRAKLAFVACFVLALLSREDIALGLALAGLVVMVCSLPRVGLGMFLGGLAFFVLVRLGVMPLFGEMWFVNIYRDLVAPGFPGYGGVVATLLSNPGYVLSKLVTAEKLTYVLQLAVPLACAWWRRPALWLALFPGLAFTLLATNRPPLYGVSFQYVYHHLPYVFAASVLGLERLARRSRPRLWAALGALAFSSLVASQQYGALFGQAEVRGGFADKLLVKTPADELRAQHLASLLALIPADASVAASERMGPHVSARSLVFPLMPGLPIEPDFVLYGYWPRDTQVAELIRLLEQRHYGVVRQAGDLVLLGLGADPSDNKALLQKVRQRRL